MVLVKTAIPAEYSSPIRRKADETPEVRESLRPQLIRAIDSKLQYG